MNAAWLAGSLALVQAFRLQAGLPALPPSALTRLSAASAPTLAAAKLEAAHALLARVPPAFVAAPSPSDAPRDAAFKEAVSAARAVVAEDLAERRLAALEHRLMPGGEVDAQALRPLYEGSPALSALAFLPAGGHTREELGELIRDGAFEEAARRLSRLKLPRAAKRALARELEGAAPLPAAALLRRRVEMVEGRLARRRYAEALAGARGLRELVKSSGLREATRLAFGVLALTLEEKARSLGAPRVHGRRPLETGERVRVQSRADCAVHQLYNHPALGEARRLLPYERFLPAVERLVGRRARRVGMDESDTRRVLAELGFEASPVRAPRDADALAAALAERGPLLASIRWTRPRDLRARAGDHAVVLRSAFRERGQWRFVMLDSHFPRPQAYSFEELQLLRAGDLAAVAPRPGASARALAASFAARLGAPERPWYLRLWDALFSR